MSELRRSYGGMSYRQRIAAATFSGVLLGLGLFLIALISYLAGDREHFVREYGSIGSLFLIYVSGGGFGGAIGGLLLPLATSAVGAVLVGTISALPLVAAAGRQVLGHFSTWDTFDYIFTLAFAALLGGVAALRIRTAAGKRSKETRESEQS